MLRFHLHRWAVEGIAAIGKGFCGSSLSGGNLLRVCQCSSVLLLQVLQSLVQPLVLLSQQLLLLSPPLLQMLQLLLHTLHTLLCLALPLPGYFAQLLCDCLCLSPCLCLLLGCFSCSSSSTCFYDCAASRCSSCSWASSASSAARSPCQAWRQRRRQRREWSFLKRTS